jgi:hypothetical protein
LALQVLAALPLPTKAWNRRNKVEKIDLKKELKHLYSPSKKEVAEADVPPLTFLMIDGQGPPGGEAYAEALGGLYSVAYTLKFASKAQGLDFKVMPLETLWWSEDPATLAEANRDTWMWTAMILVPDQVSEAQVKEAKAQALTKKNLPAITRVRLERYHEGPSAHILYIGPYSEEDETIQRIHRFITEQGHQPSGKHHEIYLSDPRRAAPEKLKTIIRQPYR